MTILAIDPGNTESAFVRYSNDRGIIAKGKVPNQELRDMLRSQCASTDMVAIEMIACYGMPVGKEVFETCVFIGVLKEIFESKGTPINLIYRKDVKMHLCNSVRAKDGNVRQALIDKLGAQGTKKNPGPTYGVSGDIWAALGVAVTYLETVAIKPK